jgi:hypothetical protein
MLRVLGAVTGQVIHEQVFAAATGMHGAGRYGAQCGLVEGGLMFLGLWGREMGKTQGWITEACNAYAQGFERRFGSLLCRELRPQGFIDGQPPHMCEELSVDAASWAVKWVGRFSEQEKQHRPPVGGRV